MITIRLEDHSIVTFDGMVVEHFYGAKSQRAHVGTIRDIKFDVGSDGKAHALTIKANVIGNYQGGVDTMYLMNNNIVPYSEQVYAQLSKMVAEIQKAMSSFRADNE